MLKAITHQQHTERKLGCLSADPTQTYLPHVGPGLAESALPTFLQPTDFWSNVVGPQHRSETDAHGSHAVRALEVCGQLSSSCPRTALMPCAHAS